MHFSVGLQDPFDFSTFFYIIAAILLLVSIIFLFVKLILKNKNFMNCVSFLRRVFLGRTKRKYLKQVEEVERYFVNDKMSMREAHQKLSLIIRRFVHDSTGLRVENLCYTEIKRLRRKNLTSLVRQYYEPEFAFTSNANTKDAIAKSKELIKTWQ